MTSSSLQDFKANFFAEHGIRTLDLAFPYSMNYSSAFCSQASFLRPGTKFLKRTLGERN
jgi:hypothetical protein